MNLPNEPKRQSDCLEPEVLQLVDHTVEVITVQGNLDPLGSIVIYLPAEYETHNLPVSTHLWE